MLVDALLQHEVEGQVNRMVKKVRGLEINQEVVEVAKEVAEVAKEVVEVAKGVAEVGKEVVEMAKKVIRVVKEVVEQLQNLLPTIVAQVRDHVNNQGNNENQDDNVINDNNQGNVRTVNMNNGRGGCSYKEFMACNPKDYDGKGGAVVYTRWIDKMESVQDMSGFGENQKVAATEPTTIQSDVLKAGMLTDEAIMNGALKKNSEKRGNNGEPGRDGNVRDDNKRFRTGRAFATTTNPIRKNTLVSHPNAQTITITINPRNLTAACGACFECGGTDHFKAACPRLNRAPRPRGNRPNQVMAVEGGQGRGNNGNQARMDWLSRHKAEIVCHEKVVRILLPNGEILRVLGERPREKVRHLLSAKAEEQKLKDIIVVRNFSEVFPDDLPGLPPS
ncbi:hypothetical protein Tco_0934023 [Tanacetum coccineum]